MKKFQDVKEGEEIFLLNPIDASIKKLSVVFSGPHPKSKQGVWFLITNTLMTEEFKSVDASKLKEARELGVNNTTLKILLDGKLSMTIIASEPAPTVICTTKEELEQWIGKSHKEMDLSLNRIEALFKKGKMEYPKKK